MNSHIATAIAHLSAVPAGKLHAQRLGVEYVYQADECGRQWFGCDSEDLEKLGAALEAQRPDAYSLWCAAVGGADPLAYIVTDRDGGNEETFAVASMDDAKDHAKRWVEAHHEETGNVVTRLSIVGPDGDEETLDVDPR